MPDHLTVFLDHAGWPGAVIEPLPGDASFRRYFRIRIGGRSAMLMHAPPPHENPGPFLNVGHWLCEHGMRAPAVYAHDRVRGLVLIEDFGDDRMRDWLDDHPDEELSIYRTAVDALVSLHRLPPGPFDRYSIATYLNEARLFTEWFCPLAGIEVDTQSYVAAWTAVLEPMMPRQQPGVTVLRDYHAENIMLLDGCEQGLIDFQDALVGHSAYDLVSLLQDARRDVSSDLEHAMIEYYSTQIAVSAHFSADYARLGAQRNAKIVGIFARLAERDGKPRYLTLIPRVWNALERDLRHPEMGPVAEWFDANIPQDVRHNVGGGRT